MKFVLIFFACILCMVAAKPMIHKSGNTLYPDPSDNTVQCTDDGRLCIGTWYAADNWDHLRDSNVTHIVSAIGKSARGPYPFAKYLYLDLADVPGQDMAEAFRISYKFIDNALTYHPESVVLVHCAAGVSRSSSIIINYWIKAEGLSYQQAYDRLKAVRHVIQPNTGFEYQLRQSEKEEL